MVSYILEDQGEKWSGIFDDDPALEEQPQQRGGARPDSKMG